MGNNVDIRIWLKLAGLLCIFLACMAAGMELESSMKMRWKFLWEMQELFQILENEMIFRHAAVCDALRYAANGSNTYLKLVLAAAAEAVESGEGAAFEKIWEKAVNELVPKKLLNENELQVLYQASASLCSSDTVMQKTLLNQNRERFLQMAKDAEKEYREKGSLIRRLSAAVGAFLVILLI